MDYSSYTYIHAEPPADAGGHPGFMRHRNSQSSLNTTTTKRRSPPVPISIPINISPAVVAYTEPNTPAFHKAGGFFQHEYQYDVQQQRTPTHVRHLSLKKQQVRQQHPRVVSDIPHVASLHTIGGPVKMSGDARAEIQRQMQAHQDAQRDREEQDAERQRQRERDQAAPVAANCPRCGVWTWNVERHMKYRCKERRGAPHNTHPTSVPQVTVSTPTNSANPANGDLALYTKRLESTAMLLERRMTSIKARNQTLESEKAEMTNNISNLVKQVAWLSRNFNMKVQEVERLNKMLAEQGTARPSASGGDG